MVAQEQERLALVAWIDCLDENKRKMAEILDRTAVSQSMLQKEIDDMKVECKKKDQHRDALEAKLATADEKIDRKSTV